VPQEVELLITKFCADTIKATNLLYQNRLYGQMLVVLYSSVDSMGLLDAPPAQAKASGNTFKNWVKKYLLPNGQFEFNEVDFWSARCSVLHTLTSSSDLSNDGQAKEIQYYAGPKDSLMAQAFVTATKEIDDGKHVPAHIEDMYASFLRGVELFASALLSNCKADPAYEGRLRRVLQMFAM